MTQRKVPSERLIAQTGAAKTSFLTKCKREACEPKAVDKNGKALTGAAKKSFLQKCEREA